MKTAIVIPARYDSSRLPGKPLLKERANISSSMYTSEHAKRALTTSSWRRTIKESSARLKALEAAQP
jgi:CMP-2-keto-3-deoxyoctulosonic acid synthetase